MVSLVNFGYRAARSLFEMLYFTSNVTLRTTIFLCKAASQTVDDRVVLVVCDIVLGMNGCELNNRYLHFCEVFTVCFCLSC